MGQGLSTLSVQGAQGEGGFTWMTFELCILPVRPHSRLQMAVSCEASPQGPSSVQLAWGTARQVFHICGFVQSGDSPTQSESFSGSLFLRTPATPGSLAARGNMWAQDTKLAGSGVGGRVGTSGCFWFGFLGFEIETKSQHLASAGAGPFLEISLVPAPEHGVQAFWKLSEALRNSG